MSDETVKLNEIAATMAEIGAANASIEAMKVENDNARADGEDDAYSSEDFWAVSEKLNKYSTNLRNA
mgnify:CR=1 FL=1|tara:strand:- start:296 stop:496 length:201 start_codon:yes stop_codon:yes gene_type:complete